MLLRGNKKEAGETGVQEFTWYYNGKPYGGFKIERDADDEVEHRYIYDLCIFEEENRNKGLGNLMIKELTEQLGQYTKFPLRLEVLHDNERALHLYKKYGFVIIGGCHWYVMEYRKNERKE
jgi:ribosomal protein S18 acetylase RimI-like enzyme